MDWYPRRPQSYRNDTWGLTLAEHGAYCLLLDYYYTSECPLPSSDERLASIIGCSLSDWLSVKENVTRYFRVSNAHLTHTTCDEVIERALGRRKDGLQRQSKYRKKLDTVTRLSRVSNAPRGEERRLEERKEESNQEHASPSGEANKKTPSRSNGTRLSENWEPTGEEKSYAFGLGLDPVSTAEDFKDHWLSKAGAAARKADWGRTWKTWCRRAVEFKQRKTQTNGGNGFIELIRSGKV